MYNLQLSVELLLVIVILITNKLGENLMNPPVMASEISQQILFSRSAPNSNVAILKMQHLLKKMPLTKNQIQILSATNLVDNLCLVDYL